MSDRVYCPITRTTISGNPQRSSWSTAMEQDIRVPELALSPTKGKACFSEETISRLLSSTPSKRKSASSVKPQILLFLEDQLVDSLLSSGWTTSPARPQLKGCMLPQIQVSSWTQWMSSPKQTSTESNSRTFSDYQILTAFPQHQIVWRSILMNLLGACLPKISTNTSRPPYLPSSLSTILGPSQISWGFIVLQATFCPNATTTNWRWLKNTIKTLLKCWRISEPILKTVSGLLLASTTSILKEVCSTVPATGFHKNLTTQLTPPSWTGWSEKETTTSTWIPKHGLQTKLAPEWHSAGLQGNIDRIGFPTILNYYLSSDAALILSCQLIVYPTPNQQWTRKTSNHFCSTAE